MTSTERLILRNQLAIMEHLQAATFSERQETAGRLRRQIQHTRGKLDS